MPLYTYKCSRCDEVFDEISSISNRDALKMCPECGHFSGDRQLDSPEYLKVNGLNVHRTE
jgi:putative FmdB family regulatory protein